MFIHIVKENETINQILQSYSVTKNELISLNMHITNWNKLITGTKIKIPMINNNTQEILEETEPFVQEYYETNLYKNKTENKEEKIIYEAKKDEDINIEGNSDEIIEYFDIDNTEKIIDNKIKEEMNIVDINEESNKNDNIRIQKEIDNNINYKFNDKTRIDYYEYYYKIYYYKYISYNEYIEMVNKLY